MFEFEKSKQVKGPGVSHSSYNVNTGHGLCNFDVFSVQLIWNTKTRVLLHFVLTVTQKGQEVVMRSVS